jgi:hypothetical protein
MNLNHYGLSCVKEVCTANTRKTTLKKSLLTAVLLSFLLPTTLFARTDVYEIKSYSNNVEYTCLMVLHDRTNTDFNYGDNYMRVAYTVNGNYLVINQQLHLTKQVLADGSTYLTLSGYNVTFITNNYGHTYNADNFSMLINTDGNADQLKTGDAAHAMHPLSSFRKIALEDLTYIYLKQFFNDGEAEENRLLAKQNEIQPQMNPSSQQQTNSSNLVLENNTDKEVYASYAIFEGSENSWVSHGWYKVEPYANQVIDLGTYNGALYLHGRTYTGRKLSWGSGTIFCIDATNAFRILNADKISCRDKAQFLQLNIQAGDNKFIFNP